MKKFLIFLLILVIGFIAYRYFSGNDQGLFSFLEKSSIPLKYETVIFEKAYGDCDSEEAPCATVKLEYPVFENRDGVVILPTVQSTVTKLILNAGMDEGDNMTSDDLYNNFVNDYKGILADFTDYFIRWGLTREVKVIRNDGKYLTFLFYEYSFAGGAHPNYTTTFYNYNLVTNKVLALKDIILDGAYSELTKIAEKKFREKREMNADESFAEAGFWFEDNAFILNENFCLTDSSLKFFFNSYEIAPYALGTTEIAIPFEELKNILAIQ
ncbi:MAG: DUF3298 and DUF4163 domain-containing protein [Bacteroidetes bacterium]|nr:DUF3298 and DUF4163 domain-containing protein [Bacteroidota bacterium]